MKKHDQVVYRAEGHTGGEVEARVLRVHKDGTATIEATFSRFPTDERVPGYLGMRFRLPVERLSPARSL